MSQTIAALFCIFCFAMGYRLSYCFLLFSSGEIVNTMSWLSRKSLYQLVNYLLKIPHLLHQLLVECAFQNINYLQEPIMIGGQSKFNQGQMYAWKYFCGLPDRVYVLEKDKERAMFAHLTSLHNVHIPRFAQFAQILASVPRQENISAPVLAQNKGGKRQSSDCTTDIHAHCALHSAHTFELCWYPCTAQCLTICTVLHWHIWTSAQFPNCGVSQLQSCRHSVDMRAQLDSGQPP